MLAHAQISLCKRSCKVKQKINTFVFRVAMAMALRERGRSLMCPSPGTCCCNRALGELRLGPKSQDGRCSKSPATSCQKKGGGSEVLCVSTPLGKQMYMRLVLHYVQSSLRKHTHKKNVESWTSCLILDIRPTVAVTLPDKVCHQKYIGRLSHEQHWSQKVHLSHSAIQHKGISRTPGGG